MGSNTRLNFLFACFLLAGFLIIGRLFWWQVVLGEKLTAAAENQHWISFEIPAARGKIFARDGFPLVTNQEAFLVFASLPDLTKGPTEISEKLAPILEPADPSTISGLIKERLNRQDLVWVPLKHKISSQTKKIIEQLEIKGLGFSQESKRDYPEGSAAAHLLGFVGSDINGVDKGYFGLEGYYNLELRGQAGMLRREKDASGKPILVGEVKEEKQKNGRDLLTSIDRAVQFMVEEKLRQGLERYGAKSGSVVIMEPKTGEILAMTSHPAYDPAFFGQFDKNLFPNPVVASSFEPGSIFKVLVMSAALDEGVVKPETRCDKCSGPRNIAGYTISTWNDKYPPSPSMIEVIQQSNNVGMVFVGEKLGIPKTVSWLQNFGLGQPTGVDLEDESTPKLRPYPEWKDIDLATTSFGQGIAVTPLQMVRTVGAIANQGKLMRPFIVKKVISEEGVSEIQPKVTKEVIKPTTARVMTEIMVNAVDRSGAKWAKPKGYRIAGKTGTAQIPLAGYYDKEKTIASFVGFAPADDPKFVMLVTLREPTSSPWGEGTSAPLWFDIAKELFTYYGILPQ
jgi:cell division protein FtsI/penicillin-binding protein 2